MLSIKTQALFVIIRSILMTLSLTLAVQGFENCVVSFLDPFGSQGSVVGIPNTLRAGKSGIRTPAGNFLFCKTLRPALDSTKHLFQWVLSPG
jgi:hypothetical protein